MTVLRAVGMAFALYSRIPVPPLDWESGARRYTLYAFPLVGLAVGGGLLLWTWQEPLGWGSCCGRRG